MLTKRTRIVAAVLDHWLIGSLHLQDTRIQEELNDSSTDFLELHEVEVDSHAKRESVANLARVTVPKKKLEFIVAPSGTHEAPEKCWNNWTAKAAFHAFAVVSEYRVWGNLHLPTTTHDPRHSLMLQAGKFFALTQASLSYGGRGVQQLSVPLLLANKDFVSCFEVGDPVDLERSGTGRQTTLEPQGDVQEGDRLVHLLENVPGLLGESQTHHELSMDSPAHQ